MEKITISSLPKEFKTFLEDLSHSVKENADSFSQEPQISKYTYEEAKSVYTEDELNELNSYMVENNLKIGDDTIYSFLTWSRFEDAHLPRLSNYGLKVPTRESIDSYDYTVYAPSNIDVIKVPSKVVVKLGVRAIVPKGKVMVLSLSKMYAGDVILSNPGIISGLREELTVTLVALEEVHVKAGDPLLKCTLLAAQVLDTDSFIPRKKKIEVITNENTINGNIEIKSAGDTKS